MVVTTDDYWTEHHFENAQTLPLKNQPNFIVTRSTLLVLRDTKWETLKTEQDFQ